MFKVFWYLKRKQGTTHAQFRAHYENSHAKLADAYIGHLMTGYQRNYITAMSGATLAPDGAVTFGEIEPDYDCIAEWIMKDEAAFAEIHRIFARPEVKKIFNDDEERFLDRKAFRLVQCDVVDTGTGDGHLTLQTTGSGTLA